MRPRGVGQRAVHTHRYQKQVPRPPRAGRREVPHACAKEGIARPALSVRGDRRRHPSPRTQDLSSPHPGECHRLHRLRGENFPFRIRTIRTDRGHEFQALFHWHVADLGMGHVYIKPRTPQLNGKVERSHRTDKDEFYQLLTYRDNVDLEKKLGDLIATKIRQLSSVALRPCRQSARHEHRSG
jgi:transposase InsO family protein